MDTVRAMRSAIPILCATAIFVFACGCGSGDGSAPAGNTGAAGSAPVAAGPRDPARNLEQLLSGGTSGLVAVSVRCPSADPPRHYPFRCRLTARKGRHGEVVSGEVKVIGVYRPTSTYAFELTYGPSGSGGR